SYISTLSSIFYSSHSFLYILLDYETTEKIILIMINRQPHYIHKSISSYIIKHKIINDKIDEHIKNSNHQWLEKFHYASTTSGYTHTFLRSRPTASTLTSSSTLANKVSSLPRPTFSPG